MQIMKAGHYMFGRPAQPVTQGMPCRLLAENRENDMDRTVGNVRRILLEEPLFTIFMTNDGNIYVIRKESMDVGRR